MSSSSEEELYELLRRQIVRQPRNFAERRPLEIENPREFREKFRLPVDTFAPSIRINRLANGAQNEAQRSFDCKTTTFNISLFPWNKLILSCYALLS